MPSSKAPAANANYTQDTLRILPLPQFNEEICKEYDKVDIGAKFQFTYAHDGKLVNSSLKCNTTTDGKSFFHLDEFAEN